MTLTQSEKAALEALTSKQLIDIIRANNVRAITGSPTSERQYAEIAFASLILSQRRNAA